MKALYCMLVAVADGSTVHSDGLCSASSVVLRRMKAICCEAALPKLVAMLELPMVAPKLKPSQRGTLSNMPPRSGASSSQPADAGAWIAVASRRPIATLRDRRAPRPGRGSKQRLTMKLHHVSRAVNAVSNRGSPSPDTTSGDVSFVV